MTKKPSLRTASYGMCVCVQMPVVCKAMLRLVVVLSAVLRSGSLTRQICFALESEIGRCNLHPGCWFISIRRANQFSFAGGMLRVGVSREGRSCTERKGCFTPEECTIIILYKHARLWREESEREREREQCISSFLHQQHQPTKKHQETRKLQYIRFNQLYKPNDKTFHLCWVSTASVFRIEAPHKR